MAKGITKQKREQDSMRPITRIGVTSFLYTAADISSSPSNDPNVYFVPAVLIDDEPIVSFTAYAASADELYKSHLQSGEYDILTCWCGIPSCAGIGRGVRVVHEGELIFWHGVESTPGVTYYFDSEQYRNAITRGISQLQDEFMALRSHPDGSIDTSLILCADFINTKLLNPRRVREETPKRR